jgi:hypothetical protein
VCKTRLVYEYIIAVIRMRNIASICIARPVFRLWKEWVKVVERKGSSWI